MGRRSPWPWPYIKLTKRHLDITITHFPYTPQQLRRSRNSFSSDRRKLPLFPRIFDKYIFVSFSERENSRSSRSESLTIYLMRRRERSTPASSLVNVGRGLSINSTRNFARKMLAKFWRYEIFRARLKIKGFLLYCIVFFCLKCWFLCDSVGFFINADCFIAWVLDCVFSHFLRRNIRCFDSKCVMKMTNY